MKISSTQQERLRRFAQMKKVHDQKLAQLEADFNNNRDRLRDPIRDEARTLLADGVPKRQLYIALGFQQQNQFNNFLEPITERMARTTEEILALTVEQDDTVEDVGFSMVEIRNGTYDLFHTNGMVYEVETTEVGGGRMIFAWVPTEAWSDELNQWLIDWDGDRKNTRVKNNGIDKPKKMER